MVQKFPAGHSDLICAIEKARTRAKSASASKIERKLYEVLSQDARIQDALARIKKVIQSDLSLPICILGESGSGKEELAKYAASVRGGPFVAVNMAAIPDDLVESELFGHVRGAFTGAVSDKKGKFEAAQGGVLFLDEIGDCPLPVQVKLLRVLQEREVTPVGATKPVKIDVKVVCATNQSLEEKCRAGTFREELLRRIDGITIVNPPLRERSRDIAALVGKFLQEKSPRYKPATISAEALSALQMYTWPGNVRELVSVVEQALLNSDFKEIGVRHLPPKVVGISTSSQGDTPVLTGNLNFAARMLAAEVSAFDDAFKAANGETPEAQKLLGLPKSTFHRKLQDLRRLGLRIGGSV